MRLAYINPNSTVAMTDSIVAVARKAAPDDTVVGLTNLDGPSAIQGAADGEAAVPGLLRLVTKASDEGADAIVLACFDDTGLAEARARAGCPVLGIGQSAYLMAALLGLRFAVVTSTEASIPVIEANVRAQGFGDACAAVRASGLPVLTIEEASDATRECLAGHIVRARDEENAQAVVLGCAGMAALRPDLAARSGVRLIDGVEASVALARAGASFVAGTC